MHLKGIESFNLRWLYKPHRKTGINRPRIESETLEGRSLEGRDVFKIRQGEALFWLSKKVGWGVMKVC